MNPQDTKPREKRTKDVDLSIEIDATPEAVWRAISQSDEVARWFALDAEVVPGVGGTVTLSWGPDCAGTGTIDGWDEGRRLSYVEGGGGDSAEAPDEDAAVIAVEYTIESRAGSTVLRMINSGFSADDDWGDYYDTVHSGWQYFLSNLKHYLECHDGTPRRMVWDRRKISLSKPDAWARLFGEGGLVVTQEATAGRDALLWTGDAATISLVSPPIHLACRCEALNDALLFIELEPGGDTYSLGTWLSLYGVAEDRAQQLDTSLKEFLDNLVS